VAMPKPVQSSGCLATIVGFVTLCIAITRLDPAPAFVVAVVAAAGVVALGRVRNKRRFDALVERYGADNARRIIEGKVWEGASAEMIRESLGAPIEVDQKVSASRTREIYKYKQTGKGRFGLRVTLDNGVVTGWEASGV
jgi:hypothetical protein